MMCGLARVPVEGRDVFLYSNADTPSHKRERMTVWASCDGGKTWPVKRLVYEGPSAYSSLVAGRPGTSSEGWVYLLFEGGKKREYEGAYVARFNLAWLLAGTQTGDGAVPDWAVGRKLGGEK
jgi:sialidase-1